MYNQLTDDEKVPYQRKYLIDKERFEREREAYFRQHPEMDYRMDAKQKATYMNDKYMKFWDDEDDLNEFKFVILLNIIYWILI